MRLQSIACFAMIGETVRRWLPSQTIQNGTSARTDARQPGTGGTRVVGLSSMGQLLDLPVNHLARVPIEVANLLCATGLPDTLKLNIGACLATLDEMTKGVLAETRRHAYRFQQNPAEFEGKESVYRMIVLITVVQEDFNVRYDAEAVERKIYEKSGEGFLHSLLDPRKGERSGTCANMPVLYAAIARLLGYPVYLVCAKGHMFCRWHDSQTGERFNVEGSGRGFAMFDDKHYMSFPHEIKPIDVHSGLFLKNLTPPEEIANFLTTRGHVLLDRNHVLDATVAYAQTEKRGQNPFWHLTHRDLPSLISPAPATGSSARPGDRSAVRPFAMRRSPGCAGLAAGC